MMISSRSLAIFLIFASVGTLAAEPVDQFLQKARAQLGAEKALDGVKSLHYKGEVISATGDKVAELELFFEKPNFQLLREMRGEVTIETAVNRYEGYAMSFEANNPAKKQLQVLNALQVKRLRANAVENLYFFDGPEKMRGASITDEGAVNYKGETARKIRFNYPDGLFYIRYFNPQTAKLIATESSDGMTMMEKNFITSGGIKFPKEVDSYDNSGKLMHTVKFTEVTVNEEIDSTIFDFPE